MTPEQRAQLQGLAEALLEDMDLRWQVDQLSSTLQGLFPQMGWDRRYQFSGNDPLAFAEAAHIKKHKESEQKISFDRAVMQSVGPATGIRVEAKP